ncbi:hypothetical protein OXYTRIMIC_032 [Oxytricha trifallax]|uniref:Uncharacterized protein n=1 Tax=Oxytricha trifallax TaxID=1172189 RepID=A0A073IBL8_9SPIT|nr:hypothetical protein OXYTRIMIC_032 [Oxytricha trifallax]
MLKIPTHAADSHSAYCCSIQKKYKDNKMCQQIKLEKYLPRMFESAEGQRC